MVILVDLDGEASDATACLKSHGPATRHDFQMSAETLDCQDDRPNPNINSFSAALSCYPVVSHLASYLDLNSLHNLSATCRQFRANLLQFRTQLVKQTLRCINEETSIGPRLADRMREWRGANGRLVSLGSGNGGRITSGRVGACARDLVVECRRCGTVVCRNCTVKPPPPGALKERHRRLCRTCIKMPLRTHTSLFADDGEPTFTEEAFARDPCSCRDAVHICLSCGNALRSADTTYMRGWTWRTRYSTYLGGLGTGIGEGNEGVECGKGDRCIDAREVEKEIDCDAEELAALKREIEEREREGRSWGGTSYLMQEMEGIGGVVKKKVKKRVRVGQAVREYEDERETGEYLARERDGVNRSWCCWCLRIIPGAKDQRPVDLGLKETSSDASSM